MLPKKKKHQPTLHLWQGGQTCQIEHLYFLLAFVLVETVVLLNPPCTNAFPLPATLKDDTTTKTNSKTTDKMPTLRKIKRAATQRTSRHNLQHILFCPTAPKPTHHPTSGQWTILRAFLTITAFKKLTLTAINFRY